MWKSIVTKVAYDVTTIITATPSDSTQGHSLFKPALSYYCSYEPYKKIYDYYIHHDPIVKLVFAFYTGTSMLSPCANTSTTYIINASYLHIQEQGFMYVKIFPSFLSHHLTSPNKRRDCYEDSKLFSSNLLTSTHIQYLGLFSLSICF